MSVVPSQVPDKADYRVFGLHIRSAIALPELHQSSNGDVPDVTIVIGRIPDEPDQAGVVLSFEGAGRYLVLDGQHILVEPEAGAPAANVRLYLLGSAMGVLLHQRGLLPLHANAIRIDSRAFAFMGASGAGKSTLAALFHDAGYEVIADDVCVVGFDENGRAIARAGIPRLRLWEDLLAATGRSSAGFALSYAGDDQFQKFDVPLMSASGAQEAPLAGIYLLDRSDDFRIGQLTGAEAVEALFANTYRGAFVQTAGDPREHWDAALRLIRQVPIFRLSRPWKLAGMADHLAEISAHARQVGLPRSGFGRTVNPV